MKYWQRKKQRQQPCWVSVKKRPVGWYLRAAAGSSTYDFENEHINILFKDGSVKDISEVDDALINENLSGKIKKYYICYPGF